MTNNKGFTLVELLVVIAIIGILSSVIVVSLMTARNKAIDTKILSSVKQMKGVLESGYLNGSYADIEPTGTQVANVVAAAPNLVDILSILSSIGDQVQNANVSTIGPDNVDLFTDGAAVQVGPTPPGSIAGAKDSGIVIFTTKTAGLADDFAVYATTTTGYVCIDSYGTTILPGEGTLTGNTISSVPLADGHVACL